MLCACVWTEDGIQRLRLPDMGMKAGDSRAAAFCLPKACCRGNQAGIGGEDRMFREIRGIEDENILRAIRGLPAFYFQGGWADEIRMEFFRLPAGGEEALGITVQGDQCRVGFRERIHLFRALGILRENAGKKDFRYEEKMYIPRIGVMIDASRNSVPDPGFLRAVLDRMALMGLNCLILYMEDVYELEGEPRFGYMRGGYTREQLRQTDDYADAYGIEIVGSIQVLGHLEKVLRFPEYASLQDSPSCLLAGEEKTYELIGKMLRTMGECFRSRMVIVGMDETHGLGEGRYRQRNGVRRPLDIFLDHLQRVHALARENGLKIGLYSDMLFSYSSPRHVYLDPGEAPDPEIRARIPEDAELIYWDYYSRDPGLLDGMMKRHRETGNAVYAGPLLSVSSFCVNYPYTFRTAEPALEAVKKYHIPMAYGCLWHDDGGECCDWLGLLGMQYYAESAYREGSVGSEALALRFTACTGLCAQWFTDAALLDAVPCSNPENRWPPNSSKYLLWQDPLEGLYDGDLHGLQLDEHYGKTAQRLEEDLEKAGEEGWFLQVPLCLAKALQLKTALGEGLHQHYKDRNRAALQKDMGMLEELLERVKALRIAHRQQWMKTCSPFGWSRLDLRYGGLTARLETAVCRLGQYLDGSLSELPELEALRYEKDRRGPFLGNGIWKTYDNIATLSDG